jgi:hypothetical protein
VQLHVETGARGPVDRGLQQGAESGGVGELTPTVDRQAGPAGGAKIHGHRCLLAAATYGDPGSITRVVRRPSAY